MMLADFVFRAVVPAERLSDPYLSSRNLWSRARAVSSPSWAQFVSAAVFDPDIVQSARFSP